jgi:DNA-binding transcriptional LysR family regulator
MDWHLAHLKTLAAVAHHGSFSRAALALGLTQPAISMQIRQLEEALGAPVLVRTGRQVRPSPAGEILLAHAERALRELDGAADRLHALRGVVAGRVRLGTSEAVLNYLLPPILARLCRRHPALDVRLVTGTARQISEAVIADELDLGIVALPVRRRELVAEPLFSHRMVAVASPRSDWGRRRAIDAATLVRDRVILYGPDNASRELIDEWFEAALVARPLEPALRIPMGSVRRRDKPRGPALDALLSALAGLRHAR